MAVHPFISAHDAAEFVQVKGLCKIVALAAVAGCAPHLSPSRKLARDVEDYARAMAAESAKVAQSGDTTYQRRMAELIRRSRLVPTDSLARLVVAQMTVPARGVRHLHDEKLCETYRLLRRHGYAALQRATYRMNDSLRRTGFDENAIPPANLPSGLHESPPCMIAADSIASVPDSLSAMVYPTRFMDPPVKR